MADEYKNPKQLLSETLAAWQAPADLPQQFHKQADALRERLDR